MKRPLGPMLAVFVLAGCRTPSQPNDPFLYRSTITPPGTLTQPGAPQPYYPSTGTPAAIPGPAPPLVSPGYVAPPPQAAPIPVSPAPVYPAGPPGAAAPRNNYVPPGGFNFPQSSSPLPTAPTAQPAAAPPPGNNPPAADTGVISAAAWQQTPDKLATTAAPGSAHQSEPSIRIVEPPAKPATDDAAKANVAIVSPGTPSSPPNAKTATDPFATGRSSTPPNAPARPAATPEITDLPLPGSSAGAPASNVAAAGPVPRSTNYPPVVARSAAEQAPAAGVSLPADRPGASYGYDPGYKNVRGRLEYSFSSRVWRIRYLPSGGATDANGGVATIADPRQLNGFESGDFVTIQGTLSPGATSGSTATLGVDRIQRQ